MQRKRMQNIQDANAEEGNIQEANAEEGNPEEENAAEGNAKKEDAEERGEQLELMIYGIKNTTSPPPELGVNSYLYACVYRHNALGLMSPNGHGA